MSVSVILGHQTTVVGDPMCGQVGQFKILYTVQVVLILKSYEIFTGIFHLIIFGQ